MTSAEMIAANWPADAQAQKERFKALRAAMAEADREYEEEASKMAMTSEDLALTCNL